MEHRPGNMNDKTMCTLKGCQNTARGKRSATPGNMNDKTMCTLKGCQNTARG